MESNRKVKITNKENAQVSVRIDDLRFQKVWLKKGASQNVDFELVKEALFDNGFYKMLKKGVLYIESKQDRVDLGLEEQDEELVIVLTDNQIAKLLKVDSVEKLRDTMEKVSTIQKNEIAEYAIENQILDIAKAKVIKELTGRDIIRAVQLAEDNKEA